MKAHVIKEGVVVNTIEVDGLDFMPGLVLATEGEIGWLYDGEKFTAPVEQKKIPNEITMRQCRLQLLAVGLLDDVDSAIASIEDQATQRTVKIEWEYAAVVLRQSTWVNVLSTVLGLSSDDLDDLFIEASLL